MYVNSTFDVFSKSVLANKGKYILSGKIIAFFLLPFLLINFTIQAQQWDFKGDKNSVKVPIDLINHIITIPVWLNGEQLTFILDTGVKETLLFGNVDSVILNNVTSINFYGLGVSEGIKGALSLGNMLVVGDSALIDHSHDLYVIVDSTINLSKNVGVPIHGILGSNFFQNHIVRIDYVKKNLYAFKSLDGLEKMLKKYTPIKLDIVKDRPFVDISIHTADKFFNKSRMLIDLGNSDPLMIFPTELENYVVTAPYVYEFLGQGFNGNIYGKRNRIQGIDFGGFNLKRLFVSHPDTNSYSHRRLAERRVGSVGNQVMSRFDVFFNYADSMMYIRKNKFFSEPFNIDMSGLEIRHAGFIWIKSQVNNKPVTKLADQGTTINLGTDVKYQIELVPSYIIHHVRENSPADIAGVKEGDFVYKVNGRYAGKMGLERIRYKLQEKDDYGINLEVKRGDEFIKFRFKLVDPIPLN